MSKQHLAPSEKDRLVELLYMDSKDNSIRQAVQAFTSKENQRSLDDFLSLVRGALAGGQPRQEQAQAEADE